MKYRQFLFDLDDTLLDFRASERLSLHRTLQALGTPVPLERFHPLYQRENARLWALFETGGIGKDALKVARFERSFAAAGIDADPVQASAAYLEFLPETVVLVDGAGALCEQLAGLGEIGIITNGIESVQSRRIAASGLAPWISFVATSEACGHAKPDSRFFAYSAARFRTFRKPEALIVGDRLEADVLGGNQYGIDTCWFNPQSLSNPTAAVPTLTVSRLADLPDALARVE